MSLQGNGTFSPKGKVPFYHAYHHLLNHNTMHHKGIVTRDNRVVTTTHLVAKI